MANTNEVKPIWKLCATTSDKLSDFLIKDGQLIFIQDSETIAFDWRGKRKYYNQIEELETDYDRENLLEPVNRKYYFVIGTGVLWRYFNGWTQITSKPEEVVCIGIELPELGKENVLYVQKEEREILVWDEEKGEYIPVANYTGTMSTNDVSALFKLYY